MWHKICLTTELEPLMGKYVEIGERQIALFKMADDTLYAVDNLCPHSAGPMCRGDIQDLRVICPWHGWEFNLTDGQCTHIPNTRIETFKTKIEDNFIFVFVD